MPADPFSHAPHSDRSERTPGRAAPPPPSAEGSKKAKPRRSITKAVPQDGDTPRSLRVCFVTGTRAEFGLMRTALVARSATTPAAVSSSSPPACTSTPPTAGRSTRSAPAGGRWTRPSRGTRATARRLRRPPPPAAAAAGLAGAFQSLRADVVMVVGDRVEAFAAASAGHLVGPAGRARPWRRPGVRTSGRRAPSRDHQARSRPFPRDPPERRADPETRRGPMAHPPSSARPGSMESREEAAPPADVAAAFPGLRRHRFALLALHPVDADDALEFDRASNTLSAVLAAGVPCDCRGLPEQRPRLRRHRAVLGGAGATRG